MSILVTDVLPGRYSADYRVERRSVDDRVVYVAVCGTCSHESRGLINFDDERTWWEAHQRLARHDRTVADLDDPALVDPALLTEPECCS